MRQRTKAIVIAGLLALILVLTAGRARADEPPLWQVLACAAAEAAYGHGSDPWILLGCAALDHPNPQA